MFSFFVCSLFVIAVTGNAIVSSGQGRQMGGVGITVFSDRNLHGTSATYREDTPDLEPLGLNDKISSLRVARGEQWEICEHSNYQGRCVVVSGPRIKELPLITKAQKQTFSSWHEASRSEEGYGNSVREGTSLAAA